MFQVLFYSIYNLSSRQCDRWIAAVKDQVYNACEYAYEKKNKLSVDSIEKHSNALYPLKMSSILHEN